MYNVIFDNKIIAKVGRRSGVGVTFHFPFDEENGYVVYLVEGNNLYVTRNI